MLPNMSDEAGGLPIWTLSVLIVLMLSAMMFRPVETAHTTLKDGLGPKVETQALTL